MDASYKFCIDTMRSMAKYISFKDFTNTVNLISEVWGTTTMLDEANEKGLIISGWNAKDVKRHIRRLRKMESMP